MTFYNHLPNHTILDSKFALALLIPSVIKRGGLCGVIETQLCLTSTSVTTFITSIYSTSHQPTAQSSSTRPNMWVIKDAETNGAGGIWILSKSNHRKYLDPNTSPLKTYGKGDGAKYVIQRYSHPLMLHGGRKAHVRLYGLLRTSATGEALPWISRAAFLHVSNKDWGGYEGGDEDDGEVHISNCCANSGNSDMFKGEICVNLERASMGEEGDEEVNRIFKGTWGMVKQAVRGCLMAFSEFTSLSEPPEGYSQAR